MKNQAVSVAIILAIALVLCTWIASNALISFGNSLQNCANDISVGMTNSAANSRFPSVVTFHVEGGNEPLKIATVK